LIIDAYEARLAERERLITVLVEQIEYLRAKEHMPTATVAAAAVPPQVPELDFSDVPADMKFEMTPAPSDEEEEIEAMVQAGVLSEAEAAEWRARLAATSPDDIIE
jgi:hypothetical protein